MRVAPKSLALLLAPLAFAWCAWLFLDPKESPNFYDYGVYARAGRQALAHETVYAATDHFQYKYAPSVALAFGATLGSLAPEVGPWVFTAFNVALWILLFSCVSGRAWELARKTPSPSAVALVPILAVFFYAMPLRDELKLGQTNAVPYLALFLAFRPRGRAADWPRGLALSVALQFKLYAALAIPALALRRGKSSDWRVLAWAAAWTLAINGAALGLYHGWGFALSENLAWIQTLFRSSDGLVTIIYNVSILGTLSREFGRPAGFAALGLAIVGFLGLLYRRRDREPFFLFAMVAAWVPLLNPIAWPYWMLLSFPAFAVAAVRILDDGLDKHRGLATTLAVALPGSLLQNTPHGLHALCLITNAAMCLALEVAWPRKKTYA